MEEGAWRKMLTIQALSPSAFQSVGDKLGATFAAAVITSKQAWLGGANTKAEEDSEKTFMLHYLKKRLFCKLQTFL